MELKPDLPRYCRFIFLVLIVPYGIETTGRTKDNPEQHVLIVPYGIETRYRGVKTLLETMC